MCLVKLFQVFIKSSPVAHHFFNTISDTRTHILTHFVHVVPWDKKTISWQNDLPLDKHVSKMNKNNLIKQNQTHTFIVYKVICPSGQIDAMFKISTISKWRVYYVISCAHLVSHKLYEIMYQGISMCVNVAVVFYLYSLKLVYMW